MSNKQSSIEWLFQKLWDTPKDKLNWHSILKQAKAMHKDEIENACNIQRNDYRGMPTYNKTGEQYYKEIFGGNNEL